MPNDVPPASGVHSEEKTVTDYGGSGVRLFTNPSVFVENNIHRLWGLQGVHSGEIFSKKCFCRKGSHVYINICTRGWKLIGRIPHLLRRTRDGQDIGKLSRRRLIYDESTAYSR